MACPICAWSPIEQDYLFLFETQLWRVVLAPNQSLLGRCIVQLKRHEDDLAKQTEAELEEWLNIVKVLEPALQSAFGATMFNWSCYMNHSYRTKPYEPHIHWWAVPRYQQPVFFGGQRFTDPTFGEPYEHGRYITVTSDLRGNIVARLQQAVEEHEFEHRYIGKNVITGNLDKS